ncbi:unnamed protein product [Caenorhabditis bovis]|uniref:Uncharacterized protein n=1 Tax=Caenorhabditis bovis TaxID=2654633 RepID=A0A8S1FBX4_9PELO|nr:unnamed protein product [Caenorhabditis bovis]
MVARGRVCCLSLSTALALLSCALLLVSLLSASFRYFDESGARRSYGLIRFCYSPPSNERAVEDDSNSKICHLRTYINSAYCVSDISSSHKSTRNCFGEFELATIILMSASMACCLLAFFFSICTIFTSFGALAHSVILIAATICSVSGFFAYTFFYELKENQYETIKGYQFQLHYGWAYYIFGFAGFLQFVAVGCSLFGSAMVLVHKNKKRQSKVQSTSL